MKILAGILYVYGLVFLAVGVDKLAGVGAAMIVLGVGFIAASLAVSAIVVTRWVTK